MGKAMNKRGRPKGMRATQLDIQRRLCEHPDRQKVIESIYRAALDDDHKCQAVAMKLIMDRVLPVSLCDKDSDINKAISINITSVSPDDMPKWDKNVLIDATPANDEGYE